MGEQHYRQVRDWKAPHITQSIDIYKMKEAMLRGYTYICIMSEDVLFGYVKNSSKAS